MGIGQYYYPGVGEESSFKDLSQGWSYTNSFKTEVFNQVFNDGGLSFGNNSMTQKGYLFTAQIKLQVKNNAGENENNDNISDAIVKVYLRRRENSQSQASLNEGMLLATINVTNVNQSFSVFFAPNQQNYNSIIFEISRTSLDDNRIVQLSNFKVYYLKNIIGVNAKIPVSKSLKKIGIQSAPGFKFAVNGEQIMLGRSGSYELDEENIEITNLNILDTNKPFILDYEY